jgi:4-hydroxy-3-polyprenylbenzoate decarboxylase
MFGQFIHELVGPMLPAQLPGVHAVHAVDAAGVHPLLLAIGSERYVPYQAERRPRELLTQANAILGQGQLSLAKFLLIAAHDDDPRLDIQQVEPFLRHVLARVDWQRDLHFQTCTTIDTLDYSGTALNEGSKLVVAAAGEPRRTLPASLDEPLSLPESLGFGRPRVAMPGVLVVQGPAYQPEADGRDRAVERFCGTLTAADPLNRFPLVVVADDSDFTAGGLNALVWTTFTRSNPARDVYGIEPFMVDKHWGCHGSLVIDARAKPHHAPPLIEDPEVTRRVEALAAPGRPLHGIL